MSAPIHIECCSTHCERRQECAAPNDCVGNDVGKANAYRQLRAKGVIGEAAMTNAEAAIAAYNADPNRPFDRVSGRRVYYRARLPILATDCDYEIVSISGVQGRRIA